jgi:Kdo2-lipid IVA lauroyltransferase/acyltransferase
MKRPRSPRADLLVYIAVRIVVCIIQALPFPIARRLACGLAWMAYRVDRRHREVARENLYHAFPELRGRPAECDRLVRQCYRHFCLVLIEMAFLPRKLHSHNWRKYITLVGFPPLVDGMLSNRPLLMVTGHFGNWEMAGFLIGVLGFRSYAIARTLDNPHLERFLKKFRQKTGQTILAKKGDFDNISGVLTGGGKLATLGDQDAGERGLFVNFFNRPASTHKAVALMALQFDVPMIVAGVPRIGHPMKYEVIIEDAIFPEEYRDRPNAVREITERYTAALERLARRHPEQYFWLHRRWKHRPRARSAKQAA